MTDPKNVAGCIIRDNSSNILLLRRVRPDHIQWELPGGKQEPGEELTETAKREVYEELGVVVDNLVSIGSDSFVFLHDTWLYHWFEADIVAAAQPKIMEPSKFDDLRYWSLSDMIIHGKEMSLNVQNLTRFLIQT